MKELRDFVGIKDSLSVRKQCLLLDIPRSSQYYEKKPESEKNLEIMRRMDEHNLNHPTHGVLQMQDYLFLLNFQVNQKRVRRLLRLMGIMAIYPKPNLSKLGLAKYIKPYLLRDLKIEKSNHVWEIDITYIPMAKGFLYLTAIIDVFSRYIVGWGLYNSLDANNCIEVLKEALKHHCKPEIINSDQGCQFTSVAWTELLEEENIKISMDGKGRAIDNIYIERFWRTVKQDYVYLNPAEDGHELYHGLNKYIHYYNHDKTHQGIDRQIPADLYSFAA